MNKTNRFKFRIWLSDTINKSNQQMIYGDINNKKSWKELWDNYNAWLGNIKEINQFTGLLDSNNKEIYEGDICIISWKNLNNHPATHHSEIRQIIFNEARFEFQPLSSFHHFYYIPKNCQIIGNIFENPELLNK